MINDKPFFSQSISESDYRLMVSNCPFGIVMFDSDLNIIFANPSCIKMLNVDSIDDINALNLMPKIINKDETLKKFTNKIPAEYNFALNLEEENYYSINLIPVFSNDSSIAYVIGYVTDITQQKIEEENMENLSFYDSLTGLHNRRYFEKEAAKLSALSDKPIGIIFGDVNGLKLTNDVFGHFQGDKLLKTMADILTNSTRDLDIVSRFSGDEFIIMLPDANEVLLENTCRLVATKCKLFKYKYIKPSISLGYAIKESKNQDLRETILLAEEKMYKDKASKSKHYRREVIKSLRKIVEKIDYEGRDHIEKLKSVSLMLGKNVGLSESSLKHLSLLAELHDIGKISIDKKIFKKKDKLTDEEWEAIKKHTENGYQIAQSSSELLPIAEEILSHHERWDGTGYPNNLKGDEIPILSRIFAIADSYVVMTSGSSYGKSMNDFEALDKIIKESGTHFDPDLVEAFSSILIYEKLWVQ